MTDRESVVPHSVVLHTALTPAECVARLRTATAGWFTPLTGKPVRALIVGGWAMLMPSRLWASRVPVRIRLTSEGVGTRIDARVGWATVSLVTLAVVAVVALVAIPTLLWDRSRAWALGLPAATAALLALALAGSAGMTRRSHAQVLAFVRETLHADP